MSAVLAAIAHAPKTGAQHPIEMDLLSDCELANEINALHKRALDAGIDALRAAHECGKLLLDAKDECLHGEWLEWLDKHFDGTPRTAQRFMRLAANATAVSHLNSATLTDALAVLSTPKQDKPPKPVGVVTAILPVDHNRRKPKPWPKEASLMVDAELMEHDEPPPLVVDEAKNTKWIPDDADRLWTMARTDLDKILKTDKSRERVLREVIKYAQDRLSPKRTSEWVEIDITDGPADFPSVIAAMLPHLTKGQLCALKRAIALQWETLTGGQKQ